MNETQSYLILFAIIFTFVIINQGFKICVARRLHREQNVNDEDAFINNNVLRLSFNFNVIDPNYFSDDNDVCSICLTNFKDIEQQERVYRTKCNHFFHKNCIKTWINSNNIQSYKCPLCLDEMY